MIRFFASGCSPQGNPPESNRKECRTGNRLGARVFSPRDRPVPPPARRRNRPHQAARSTVRHLQRFRAPPRALFMEPLRGSNPPWRFSCDGAPSQSAVVSPFNLTEPRRWLFSSTSCAKPLFLTPSIRAQFPEKKQRTNVTDMSPKRNARDFELLHKGREVG